MAVNMAVKVVSEINKRRFSRSPYEIHEITRNVYGKRRDRSILSTAIFERPSQKESGKNEKK